MASAGVDDDIEELHPTMVALPVATDATARSRDRETATSGRGPPSQEQERRRQRLQMQREPSLRSSSIAKALSPTCKALSGSVAKVSLCPCLD